MSTPFNKNPDKGDRLEHMKVGISFFMQQKEDQVRRAIAAYNRMIGTDFKSTLEIEEDSIHYANMVPNLLQDQGNCWAKYLEVQSSLWKNRLEEDYRIKTLVKMATCLAIGLVGGWLAAHGI